MITHFERDGQAACTYRIRPPWLTEDTARVDCKSCERTDVYARSVPMALRLPPVPDEHAVADPRDADLLNEWAARLAG